MFRAGLTGGIACGKSTVAQMLTAKGALLLDVDQLAKEVVEPKKPAWKEIVSWLGEDVLTADSSLNRRKIAGIVFNNNQALEKLNKIVHPRVEELLHTRSKELEKLHPNKIQIWDIPLLFEAGYEDAVDYIIVVASDREDQIQRLKDRDGLSEDEALRRIKSQLDLEIKVRAADYVLYNACTKEFLEKQIDVLWEKLKRIKI
ncbi:MAG: dephospho-CoA kinase [Firmicutes bacterium]|nr:dephospho-CoA kinase [Bacillota bacterium]